MLATRVPALELVVQTTRDTRTGEKSQMCWVEYSGNESSVPVRQKSKRHQSSNHGHEEMVVARKSESSSRGREHGIGYAEASFVHGSERSTSPKVSQYHVEVHSSKGRGRSISREGRSRRSTKEVDIDHVTVYQVEDRHRSKSRSRKSKSSKSKRSSKSKSRRKHRPRSRSSSRRTESVTMITGSSSMGNFPRIEYAEPSPVYPTLAYHLEDANIVDAVPPPEVSASYIPTSYYQAQAIVLDAPLVTTTGPGEEHSIPGIPKPRYFIKPDVSIPGSPVLVASHYPPGASGGPVVNNLPIMHGAITKESELRKNIYSSDSSDTAIYHSHAHNGHEGRRYTTSGSAHGHGHRFAVLAKYHSSGSHEPKRHSYHSSSASSSTTDSSDDAHCRTVYIGREHLRSHTSGHRGVRVRYGGEKEHVVDVGMGYSRGLKGGESNVPSGSGGGRLSSRLKSAAQFLTVGASAGLGRRGSSSSSSSKSTSSSSRSSTSSNLSRD